ncbi:expressed unknown protein [Seminavis robusta]|uniref:Circumsporozoite protein n=1 Tax=Seminavis robusta TaxID=568900 RepID=A0A9N8ED07_9STRA|nr:expressed unknown protein [Seminavis robusta]|eukprot:Sro911_g219200.1 n/a (437) ;mRNA; r:7776-9086
MVGVLFSDNSDSFQTPPTVWGVYQQQPFVFQHPCNIFVVQIGLFNQNTGSEGLYVEDIKVESDEEGVQIDRTCFDPLSCLDPEMSPPPLPADGCGGGTDGGIFLGGGHALIATFGEVFTAFCAGGGPPPVSTDAPTMKPSISPSTVPSLAPSVRASSNPSSSTSETPSSNPSAASDAPSVRPSSNPSAASDAPSVRPSSNPSEKPSSNPSAASDAPSSNPSAVPTPGSMEPSAAPSSGASCQTIVTVGAIAPVDPLSNGLTVTVHFSDATDSAKTLNLVSGFLKDTLTFDHPCNTPSVTVVKFFNDNSGGGQVVEIENVKVEDQAGVVEVDQTCFDSSLFCGDGAPLPVLDISCPGELGAVVVQPGETLQYLTASDAFGCSRRRARRLQSMFPAGSSHAEQAGGPLRRGRSNREAPREFLKSSRDLQKQLRRKTFV